MRAAGRGRGSEQALGPARSLSHTHVCAHSSASARMGPGAAGEKPDFPSTPFLPPPPAHKPTIK